MKVICPKCQFENQADSTRVVCARCATIIEVRLDQGSGFDSNGKRQTARLPFAANSSNSGNLSSSGNLNSGTNNSGSLGNNSQNRDVYATRVGDDFDDVLDIPRPQQNEFHNTSEATPVFEDVFATNYDSASNYDYSAYEKKSGPPSGGFQTEMSGQRVTQDYTQPAEPEFMGWPVLPENNIEDEEEAVGNAGSSRGGVIARVALIVLAFGVLSFLAYYFLWDYIAKRNTTKEVANVEQPAENLQPAGDSNPAAVPQPTTTIIVPKPAQGEADGDRKPVEITPMEAPTGPKGQAETPKPAQQPSVAPPTNNMPATPNRGNITIQVGSYPDKGEADSRVDRLKAGGVDARVVRADIPGKGTYYRVQVGGFPSREQAQQFGNQMRAKQLVQDFIVTTIGK